MDYRADRRTITDRVELTREELEIAQRLAAAYSVEIERAEIAAGGVRIEPRAHSLRDALTKALEQPPEVQLR